jgi:insecticidal toxin complex protein TccC
LGFVLRDYLPALDLSTNQEKQQSAALHIGTHILSESSKDNAQTTNGFSQTVWF